ncbi:hypothetical protein ACFLS0_07080 [Candidatus Bipolaricaulota bacterium]
MVWQFDASISEKGYCTASIPADIDNDGSEINEAITRAKRTSSFVKETDTQCGETPA